MAIFLGAGLGEHLRFIIGVLAKPAHEMSAKLEWVA
jgi:hypothetical protein